VSARDGERGQASVWLEPTERTCAQMGYLKTIQAWQQANDPEVQEHLHRARRDVLTMLEGFSPKESEAYNPDYGPWIPQMTRLAQAFEQHGQRGVQQELAKMLHEGVAEASVLLDKAERWDGWLWKEALEELWKEIEARERRAAAEQRMRERLARTTGDNMADEIMAMLREQDLSRTDIYRRYSRNVSAQSINDALFVLERLGWARWKMVSTGGRGREVWYLPSEE
jgi:hypothetical protein